MRRLAFAVLPVLMIASASCAAAGPSRGGEAGAEEAGAREARADEERARGEKFVGRWHPESAKEGAIQRVRADGTGVNIDGSKFLWYFEGRHLVVRRPTDPADEESILTIHFTRDARAYRLTLEHGNLHAVLRRVGDDGRPLGHERPADAEYEVAPAPRRPAGGAGKGAGPQRPVGRLVVHVDAAAAPQLRDWAEDVAGKMQGWYPKVVAALGRKETRPVLEITLVLRDGEVPPAETKGRKILISSKWVAGHLEEKSVVAHEMVHVLQRYGTGAPAWLVEGIPDYVRFYVIDPGAPAADFVMDIAAYDNGYKPTAAMLDWLERERGPGVVSRLDAALREGVYTELTFEQITGLKPRAAWEQFASSYRKKHPAK